MATTRDKGATTLRFCNVIVQGQGLGIATAMTSFNLDFANFLFSK